MRPLITLVPHFLPLVTQIPPGFRQVLQILPLSITFAKARKDSALSWKSVSAGFFRFSSLASKPLKITLIFPYVVFRNLMSSS